MDGYIKLTAKEYMKEAKILLRRIERKRREAESIRICESSPSSAICRKQQRIIRIECPIASTVLLILTEKQTLLLMNCQHWNQRFLNHCKNWITPMNVIWCINVISSLKIGMKYFMKWAIANRLDTGFTAVHYPNFKIWEFVGVYGTWRYFQYVL